MGYIYKITNKVNGKVYIGQTRRDIPTRWKEHVKYALQPDGKIHSILYCAIRKYGAENFSIEELEKCSNNLLDEREVYWIKEHKSNETGYNSAIGGKGGQKYPIEEIMYWWDQGLTLKEIAMHIDLHYETISKHLKYNGVSHDEIVKRASACSSRAKKQPIYQYDLDGNFVQGFNTADEAREAFGNKWIKVTPNSREMSVAGYQWKRFKTDHIDPVSDRSKQCVQLQEDYRQRRMSA